MKWNFDPDQWGADRYRDVPISKWVKLARERHINDLKRERDDPDFPYYYDPDAADHVVWFFENRLKLIKGKRWAGKPFKPEAWQEFDILRPLFGWKRKRDGMRRYRRALILLARKNTKSTLAAGIALYMLTGDGEPGAEVYCIAPESEEQAKMVYGVARRMVKRDPLLREEIKLYSDRLECEALESMMRAVGKSMENLDGPDPHCGIVDELHLFKSNVMLSQLEDAVGAREEPMIVMISTAGYDDVCPAKEEQDYGEKILEGELENEEYFVYITSIDDPEKWQDPAEWYKANPQLGISIDFESFAADAKVAIDIPSKKNSFLVKRLNSWTSGIVSWMNMDLWKVCGGPIDWRLFQELPCYGGLDIGRTQDLTALCLAFREPAGETDGPFKVFLQMHYWLPEEQDWIAREKQDKAAYRRWIREGWIKTTPGRVTRNDIIRRDIEELRRIYDLQEIALDRWSAAELAQNLVDDGVNVVKHAQSMVAFKDPIDSYEAFVLSERLRHGDNPVLTWNVRNAVIVVDGNDNKKFMKNKSKNRIDGAVSSAMALGRLLIAPAPQKFVYNSRGIYVA